MSGKRFLMLVCIVALFKNGVLKEQVNKDLCACYPHLKSRGMISRNIGLFDQNKYAEYAKHWNQNITDAQVADHISILTRIVAKCKQEQSKVDPNKNDNDSNFCDLGQCLLDNGLGQLNSKTNDAIVDNLEKKRENSFDGENLLPENCGLTVGNPAPSTNSKIEIEHLHGGESTSINEFPWIGLLQYSTFSRDRTITGAAASLINNRYALTVAHMLTGKSFPVGFFLEAIVLCEWDVLSENDCIHHYNNRTFVNGSITVNIENVTIHPYYDDVTNQNDIGLLRLAYPVTFTDSVRPICLPINSVLKDRFVTAGWGATADSFDSTYLLQVSLPHVEMERCRLTYPKLRVLSNDSQICAGGDSSKKACKGDSGGPLMQQDDRGRWVIVGLTSFGFKKCIEKKAPTLYTYVYHYRGWIVGNLRP